MNLWQSCKNRKISLSTTFSVKCNENLKKRNAVSGGEEMLRLRAYEKLQNLVNRGLVQKDGKQYRGLERILEAASTAVVQGPVVLPAATEANIQAN